jgi:hypothetical protein
MLTSLASIQLESDSRRFGNPNRFIPVGKCSSLRDFYFCPLAILTHSKPKVHRAMAECQPIAAPPWFDLADIDFNELVHASQLNRNTLTSYQRLLLASGRRCGRKVRGLWFFSARELYVFQIIRALAKGRIPISIEILLNAWDFAQEPPTGPFQLTSDGATTTVDAILVWNVVIGMLVDLRVRDEAL